MIRGLYTSASGMSTQLAAQEVIANNMANANTTGYKKDIAVNSAFQSLLINRLDDQSDRGMTVVLGNLGTGTALNSIHTDFSQGGFTATENKLDLAIAGDGYFVIQTPQGERYTRDGSFTLDSLGNLVTKDGNQVMGHRGSVNLNSRDVQINEDGSVIIDGAVANELRIVTPENPDAFAKVGNNLFALQQGSGVNDSNNSRVLQGYLESANVNVVSEMVSMINGLRTYEAGQRMITFQDETLERLINEVAKV